MKRAIILFAAALGAALVAAGSAVYALAGHQPGNVLSITGCVTSLGKLVKVKVGDVPTSGCGGATEVHLSGGDVTAVLAGNGLIAGGIQGSVTLAVDPTVVQRRVTKECGPNAAISQINEDGSVACGGGDVTGVLAGAGLTGGGTEGSVTLGVDPTVVQSRVTQSCPAESMISRINQDGTVVCPHDDTFVVVSPVFGASPLNSDSPKFLTVACPAGTIATGGGAEVTNSLGFSGPSSVVLNDSMPGVASWQARASEQAPTDANWRLQVRVICGRAS